MLGCPVNKQSPPLEPIKLEARRKQVMVEGIQVDPCRWVISRYEIQFSSFKKDIIINIVSIFSNKLIIALYCQLAYKKEANGYICPGLNKKKKEEENGVPHCDMELKLFYIF